MRSRLEFDWEWRISLFTLLLLPLLIALGFWQLQRAEEKAALAAAFAAQQARPPVPLVGVAAREPGELAYLRVSLRGHFRQGEYFLLDNRIQGGRYGNEVLAVFELENGSLALVNRGWVPADPARRQAPAVPPAVAGTQLLGHLYVSPGEPYLLAEQRLAAGWPKPIQAVEMDKLAAALDGELFPHPVRIDAGEAAALSVDWQLINQSPEKHTGYAVQWFAMAAALGLIYLLRSSNLWQLIRGGPAGAPSNE